MTETRTLYGSEITDARFAKLEAEIAELRKGLGECKDEIDYLALVTGHAND